MDTERGIAGISHPNATPILLGSASISEASPPRTFLSCDAASVALAAIEEIPHQIRP